MRYLLIIFCLITLTGLAQQPAAMLPALKSAPERGRVKLYIVISTSYAENQPDSAVHYASEGMWLAEKLSDHQGQASLLLALGYVNALHHHIELARSFYNRALDLYRSLNDTAGVVHTYDQLGLLDGNTKDFDQALKYYQDSHDSSGLIETYEDMGKAAEDKGEHEIALSWLLHALILYEDKNQQPEAYFTLLENISQLYLWKGDSTNALRYLKEGLCQSIKQDSRQAEVHLLNDEGKLLIQDKDSFKALNVYKQALAEAKKYQQPHEQAEALMGIATILKKQDTKACIQNLKQALGLAQQLHAPQLAARIYAALADVYRQQQYYSEAMAALSEEHHLVDSLLSADTIKDITALDNSYLLERSMDNALNLEQVNKTERAELRLSIVLGGAVVVMIIVLWLYLRKIKGVNSALQNLNEELTNSNRIKDTLFSVIGHDLKGPAGRAAQLLEMMETEEFTPEEMKGIIPELRKQTNASLELLQALFEWGKAQLQGIRVNPSDFQVQPVIERCIHLLSQQAAQKNIRLSVSLPDGLKLHVDANHFEFIIRNLLSNAIKFSYEGGTVELGAQNQEQQVVFSVKDKGIGISKDQQSVFLTSNLEVSFGTNEEQGSGLGLLMTKDFVKANHGRIWLESEKGQGTIFFIAMPTI